MSSTPEPAGTPPRRSLGALLIGGVAGLLVFGLMLAAGLLLYQRVYGDSGIALVVILAVFGGLGAYLAWLVAVLVFSGFRAPSDEEEIG